MLIFFSSCSSVLVIHFFLLAAYFKDCSRIFSLITSHSRAMVVVVLVFVVHILNYQSNLINIVNFGKKRSVQFPIARSPLI